MKIAHFIETDIPGGAEQVLLDLCQYTNCSNGNNKATVITFAHPWIKSQCQKRGIEYLELPFKKDFKSTIRLPIFGWKLSKWLKSHKFDLVHSHLFGPITGAALACWLAGIPHIGTLHDVYMIEEKPSRFLLIQLASLLKTKLITVSNHMEAFYTNNGWLRKNSIRTIYNGVELSPRGFDIRDELNLQPNTPIIVSVGRLIPLKQTEKIVQAFIQIDGITPPPYLIIVGEGPELDNIANIARKHQNNIYLLGLREDISDILASSDIFVQYSTTEGLSRSIIEASMAGLPCIVSDVGGNGEIVRHGYNGLLVDATSIEDLQNSLLTLLNDCDLRNTFAENSSTYAAENFGLAQSNEKYLNLYKQMLIIET